MFSLKRMAAASAVVVAASTIGAAAAHAEVVPGQYVSNNNYTCGGQERITGGYQAGPVYFQEKSWIFRNCGSTTLRVKADIINDTDGSCYSVGPGKIRVLAVIYAFPRQVYRGSKSC